MEEKVHKLSKKKLAYHREYYKKTHKIIKKDKLKKDLESYHRFHISLSNMDMIM
jgi:hypothetical protein